MGSWLMYQVLLVAAADPWNSLKVVNGMICGQVVRDRGYRMVGDQGGVRDERCVGDERCMRDYRSMVHHRGGGDVVRVGDQWGVVVAQPQGQAPLGLHRRLRSWCGCGQDTGQAGDEQEQLLRFPECSISV
ncbi:hypothetical protein M5D96_006895 [Drosophila gunungcola]|uniref:Secreted protein n=1 Tax=Drosophila gunungcola TaxID=103775 RepID=A0A9Q0BPY2_9MUSC|nr:hypothetical protein M5D96_006895 [Drosophila gunungcola]